LKNICELIAKSIHIIPFDKSFKSKSREVIIKTIIEALKIACNKSSDEFEFKRIYYENMRTELGNITGQLIVKDELIDSISTSTYFVNEDKSNELIKNLCEDMYFSHIIRYTF